MSTKTVILFAHRGTHCWQVSFNNHRSTGKIAIASEACERNINGIVRHNKRGQNEVEPSMVFDEIIGGDWFMLTGTINSLNPGNLSWTG